MIARVVIDSPLPHLDRPFDYLIPEALAATAVVGARVRVPFAGRLVSAVVVEVSAKTEVADPKRLKSASSIPSFDAGALSLAREIAARYGGSLWDVLRLMAPPRVASVEKQDWDEREPARIPDSAIGAARAAVADAGLDPDATGPAVWASPPSGGSGMPASALAGFAVARLGAGGSAILVAPDARAQQRLVAACEEWGLVRWSARSGGHVAVVDADDGPAPRFGSYIAALRGLAPIVIGTRPAAWQPVPRLAAMAVWDEGSTTLADPRAPYPHARTVAAMRARGGVDLLIAGHGMTADAVSLVVHGFASRVGAAATRDNLPRVEVIDGERRARDGAGTHWLPPDAWRPLRQAALESVAAVLVPQAGYAKGVACARCGAYAECPQCGDDLTATGADEVFVCAGCATPAPQWHCPECHSPRWRAVGLGVERLADQLRSMAPGVQVAASSSGTGILGDGAVETGIVVATPGALPAVKGGYRHLVIAGARTSVGALGSEAHAVRAWLHAIAHVAARREGGGVSVIGDLTGTSRAAIVGCDGWAVAQLDYEERGDGQLPPHRRAARLDGPPDAIAHARAALEGLSGVDLMADPDGAWLLATRGAMASAVTAVRAVVVARSQAGAPPLYLRVDATPGA